MISKKLEGALNEQVKHEFESSYLYLSMAAWFHGQGWDGMAQWMRVQALEEQVHAMKFFDHIKDRDGAIALAAISQPKSEWSSPLDAFEAAHKHEQFISAKINALMKLSNEEGEYASVPMLNWFVNEQIEEEATALKICQTLRHVGNDGAAIVMLDKELSTRTFQMPVAGKPQAQQDGGL